MADDLDAQFEVLERQAGIREEAERIREGRWMPDLSETTDEYFDAEHDYVRRGLRRLYFGVADVALRRRLIAAVRAIRKSWERSWDSDIASAQQDVAKAKERLDFLPWGGAAAIGGGCVALGYGNFDLAGAIGGAIVGFFMAQGYISNSRSQRKNALTKAEADLEVWTNSRAEATARPEVFSAAEEATGERDDAFDRLDCEAARKV